MTPSDGARSYREPMNGRVKKASTVAPPELGARPLSLASFFADGHDLGEPRVGVLPGRRQDLILLDGLIDPPRGLVEGGQPEAAEGMDEGVLARLGISGHQPLVFLDGPARLALLEVGPGDEIRHVRQVLALDRHRGAEVDHDRAALLGRP